MRWLFLVLALTGCATTGLTPAEISMSAASGVAFCQRNNFRVGVKYHCRNYGAQTCTDNGQPPDCYRQKLFLLTMESDVINHPWSR